jgi:hypothetical protein
LAPAAPHDCPSCVPDTFRIIVLPVGARGNEDLQS